MKKLHETKKALLLAIVTGVALQAEPSEAVPSSSNDAREVMMAVYQRDTGDKMVAHMSMSIESGRKRERGVKIKSLEFDEGTKQLLVFESPADIRNTALLSVDYDDGAKDDDQWLYLPSLRKSTRISGGDKSDSFMGTDFTYSDMTKQDPGQYELKMLKQTTKIDGEECWLIESRPKTDKAKKETGYLKSYLWISKDKLIPLQVKAWVRKGKKIKYMKFGAIKKVDGIWVAHTAVSRTTKNGKVTSTTILQMTDVKFNDDSVRESDFAAQRLGQGL
jgi:outer membrane lipoprotein-sorting protein